MAVQLVPHKRFTFAKLWSLYAKFEIRRLDIVTARKIFGTAIGMCPKEALFKHYIELEIEVEILSSLLFLNLTLTYSQLREFDRVRTLYEKYIEARCFYVYRGPFC
jgi:crooked neck